MVDVMIVITLLILLVIIFLMLGDKIKTAFKRLIISATDRLKFYMPAWLVRKIYFGLSAQMLNAHNESQEYLSLFIEQNDKSADESQAY